MHYFVHIFLTIFCRLLGGGKGSRFLWYPGVLYLVLSFIVWIDRCHESCQNMTCGSGLGFSLKIQRNSLR